MEIVSKLYLLLLTYRFFDFSAFDLEKNLTADERTIREALNGVGIVLPINMEFNKSDSGDYIFTAEMKNVDNYVINGTLICSYYQDGTIKKIENSLVKCHPVRACEIISTEEAYERIKKGRFKRNIYLDMYDKLQSIEIRAIDLVYSIDSKGFFQPVYKINTITNGYDANIIIPALK